MDYIIDKLCSYKLFEKQINKITGIYDNVPKDLKSDMDFIKKNCAKCDGKNTDCRRYSPKIDDRSYNLVLEEEEHHGR